jgi:putative aminopeptidase FrvX
MKFEKKSLKFLEKYLNTSSPTGYEHKGQEVWMDYIRPYVDKIEGSLRNLLRNHQS